MSRVSCVRRRTHGQRAGGHVGVGQRSCEEHVRVALATGAPCRCDCIATEYSGAELDIDI